MSDEVIGTLKEILSILHSMDSRLVRLEAHGLSSNVAVNADKLANIKKLSIREFLKEKSPNDGVQKTLCFAFYAEHYDGLSPFNKADLENGFRVAKEPLPPNINDKIAMCVKNGHMMEADSKKNAMKAWLVTRSGEEYVLAGFGEK